MIAERENIVSDMAVCPCGAQPRITLLDAPCYSCGRELEPLMPKFERTLQSITDLPTAEGH